MKQWFCGFGPHGEIIINNNQGEVARTFELDPGGISNCIAGKSGSHKGWTFQRIPEAIAGRRKRWENLEAERSHERN
jgi:hypothetical protein